MHYFDNHSSAVPPFETELFILIIEDAITAKAKNCSCEQKEDNRIASIVNCVKS
jgi:hypothetical protein